MNRLMIANRPLARAGLFLARLVFPGRPQTEHAKGRLAPPSRRPAGTRTVFLGYLQDALSGGGRR